MPSGGGLVDIGHGVVNDVQELPLGLLLRHPGFGDLTPERICLQLPALRLLHHQVHLPLHILPLLLRPHPHSLKFSLGVAEMKKVLLILTHVSEVLSGMS